MVRHRSVGWKRPKFGVLLGGLWTFATSSIRFRFDKCVAKTTEIFSQSFFNAGNAPRLIAEVLLASAIRYSLSAALCPTGPL
jgi:hypothetical protein